MNRRLILGLLSFYYNLTKIPQMLKNFCFFYKKRFSINAISTYKESFRFSMPLRDISVDTNQAFIVRANETLHNRIIIPTLQIVESRIGIVVITTISNRVIQTNDITRVCNFTPFVIKEIHVVGSPCLTNQKLVRTILPTQKFFR